MTTMSLQHIYNYLTFFLKIEREELVLTPFGSLLYKEGAISVSVGESIETV